MSGPELADDAGGGARPPGDEIGTHPLDLFHDRRRIAPIEVQVAHRHLERDAALGEVVAKPLLDLGLAPPDHGEDPEGRDGPGVVPGLGQTPGGRQAESCAEDQGDDADGGDADGTDHAISLLFAVDVLRDRFITSMYRAMETSTITPMPTIAPWYPKLAASAPATIGPSTMPARSTSR